MAKSIKCPTRAIGSGHDLMVFESEPHIGLHTDNTESAWDPLFPSLSAPPLLSLSLSLCKINKHFFLIKN